ncbi:MAG: metal ABC transporter ATP-binding protein [Oscillospiraceae bacterium]|jgi:zinc transport system ATP-binding protein
MIRAENLAFSYTGSRPFILDGIDLRIENGEYVSVVGDNGSGKTTLIKLILRLLRPSRGTIATDAKRIGYVPQRSDFTHSGFPITVFEMLNAYRKLLKIKNKETVFEKLELVGLSGRGDELIGNLSGGQSQKALIARALIGSPDLLILDEPSTGVDAESQRDIYRLIKLLNVENGITVVSVEHNLDAAISNSTQIYHLSGKRGHFCTPQQFAAEYLREDGGHNA